MQNSKAFFGHVFFPLCDQGQLLSYLLGVLNPLSNPLKELDKAVERLQCRAFPVSSLRNRAIFCWYEIASWPDKYKEHCSSWPSHCTVFSEKMLRWEMSKLVCVAIVQCDTKPDEVVLVSILGLASNSNPNTTLLLLSHHLPWAAMVFVQLISPAPSTWMVI